MNILGVGGPELIAIFVIMLVFAGPKRMIHWAYLLGKYTAQFRHMWSQTVDLIQKEFDDAGLDVQIPKEPPTKQSLQKTLAKTFEPVTKPLQESLNEVNKDLEAVKSVQKEVNRPVYTSKSTQPVKEKPVEVKPIEQATPVDLGSWSSAPTETATPTESNGKSSNLGTWSSYQNKDE